MTICATIKFNELNEKMKTQLDVAQILRTCYTVASGGVLIGFYLILIKTANRTMMTNCTKGYYKINTIRKNMN